MHRPVTLWVAIVHVVWVGCAGQNSRVAGSVAAPSPSGQSVLTPVDGAQDPCVNFADYACGTGKQPLGLLQEISGIMVRDRPAAIRDFLDRVIAGPYRNAKGSIAVLGEYYAHCTDARARDLGLGELRQQLSEIDKIGTLGDWAHALGALHRRGIVRALIQLSATWDAVAPDEHYVAGISVANQRLPKSAYTTESRLPAEQLTHWQVLARLVGGITPSEIEGARRVDRWLASANAAPPSEAVASEPIVPGADLEKAAFPWREYLRGLGLPLTTPIRPAASDTLDRIEALAKLPFDDLRSNLKMTIIERWASFIGMPVIEEEIRFHGEVVHDNEHEVFELRQACTDLMSEALNPWLDEAFLAGLPTPSEQPAQEMFQLVRERFARTVAAATWLDNRTREAAAAKVRQIVLRFTADPTPGLDDVVLPAGSFLDAELRTSAHLSERYIGEVGTRAERKLYLTRNHGAMYSSLVNSIWLSREFARFPWVQARPFTPTNLGSLGTILGHEIAHALSITGRRFDDAGVKRETWPQAAVSAFETRTACLENQLTVFDASAKWKTDAHRTLDEDLAESVGLEVALAAMEADAGPANVEIQESHRRDFFLAYAQQWCGFNQGREDEDKVDEDHSSLARTLSAILASVPEFAQTFHCAAGTRMAPRNRCVIW